MILLTDAISQSSNFCWIVLDETTYYISAFAVDSNGTIIDVQGSSITTEFIFSGYQRVEYIQSSGSQYIDTGIVPNYQTRMVIGVANVLSSTNFLVFAGMGTSQKSGESSAHQYYVGLSGGNPSKYRSVISHSNTAYESNVQMDLYTRHEFDVQSGSQKIDGTQYATDTILSSDSFHNIGILLFGRYEEWSNPQRHAFACRIYGCKLYQNSVLVRDFYPVYRKSDNVIGLLDIVNKVFYTNSGSGSFTKGTNVN